MYGTGSLFVCIPFVTPRMEVPVHDNYHPAESINQSSKIRDSWSGRFLFYFTVFTIHSFLTNQPISRYFIRLWYCSVVPYTIFCRVLSPANSFRSLPGWVVTEILTMRSSRLWIRSSRVVRVSDSQCRSRKCPGFSPSILRTAEFESRVVLPTLSKIIRPDWPKYSVADKKKAAPV